MKPCQLIKTGGMYLALQRVMGTRQALGRRGDLPLGTPSAELLLSV